jgi:hypothetical protein
MSQKIKESLSPIGPDLAGWFVFGGHKSDLGVTIYGKAVASFLIAPTHGTSRGEAHDTTTELIQRCENRPIE